MVISQCLVLNSSIITDVNGKDLVCPIHILNIESLVVYYKQANKPEYF